MQSLSKQIVPIFTAIATAATKGFGVPINVSGRDELVFYLQSNGTTTGGTLVIEEAFYNDADGVYSGTWSQIGATINANDFTGTKQVAYHISPNVYDHVRLRVATDITGGGTISAWAVVQ